MPSIRTNIRRAVLHNLRNTITVANGYNTTIRRVRDPMGAEEGIREFPTVDVIWGREDRLNTEVSGNDPLLDLRFELQLVCYLQATKDNMSEEQDEILADLQKFFGQNWNIPSSTGDATVFQCAYLSSEPWGPQERVPQCGISVSFEVFYSIKQTDPAVSFHG